MYSVIILLEIVCLLVCVKESNGSGSAACQRKTREYFPETNTACDPKPLIYANEGCKECVYSDTVGLKTIAIGLNLQRPDAASLLASVGADYNAIVNGPVTAVKTPCDCNKVTCLTRYQINTIFSKTVGTASNDAQSILPSFSSLCCAVQNAVVDMSFTLGKPTLATFKEFLYWLGQQNWKASADDLRTTKWCQVQTSRRCNADADSFEKGCGCTGTFSQKCDTQGSACCKETETCCKGTLTFKNYITRTEEEQLCCPSPGATCCQQNRCCASQFPVCCLPNCCRAGNKCISGQCYLKDGSRGESVPVTCAKPRLVI